MKKVFLSLILILGMTSVFAQFPVDGKFRNADSTITYLRSQYPVTPAGASDVKLRRAWRALADMVQKYDTVTVKYKGRDSLNFGSIAIDTCATLTITVTGASVSDVVLLGIPNSSVSTDIIYTAWVSATNTVTVRACNNSHLEAKDPPIGNFKVAIIR